MAGRAARTTPLTVVAEVAGGAAATSSTPGPKRSPRVRAVPAGSGAPADTTSPDPGGASPCDDAPTGSPARRARTSDPAPPPAVEARNEVRLLGRLGVGVRELTMPSGDPVINFHLVVGRPPRSKREMERRPREPTVDTLACAAWSSRCRRVVTAAEPGELLEVEGALRRRFRRAATGSPVSFYEVEVSSVRRVRGGGAP